MALTQNVEELRDATKRSSRSIIVRLLIAVMVATVIAAIAAVCYQFNRARLSERVLLKIDRLVLQPPSGVDELEWAVHVYWTHNLHCAAVPTHYASIATLKDLDSHLDNAIVRRPDIRTIEVLWDSYGRMSKSGARYRTEYEPIRDAIAKAIAHDGEEYADVRSYQDFIQGVKSTNRVTH